MTDDEAEALQAQVRADHSAIVRMPIAKLERDILRGSWAMKEAAALEGLRRLRSVLRYALAATQPGATTEQLDALRAHLTELPRDDGKDDTEEFRRRQLDSMLPKRSRQ